MIKSVISSKKVSISAIRKANEKRRKYKSTDDIYRTSTNGELKIKLTNGVTTKVVILTKQDINSAFRKSLSEYAKKL